jgi:hypothetical protein
MKKIHIPETRLFNSSTNEIITLKEQDIQIEHSLVSISKWEQKWHKPFLSTKDKTPEEMADYIRCMCMTQNVDPQVFQYMPDAPAKEINEYIADPMTATTFSDRKTSGGNEILTNEIIYWQMITLGIPVEFQKWHLNRLLTLIKVCSIKNNPNKKKMSRSEIIQRNRELNRARRAANHSAG